MANVFNDAYWQQEFYITQDDLDRTSNRIRKAGRAISLTDLTKELIHGRLEHGPDWGKAILPGWIEEIQVRLWDPAGIWNIGDRVIVAVRVDIDEQKNAILDAFIGEIIWVGQETVKMLLDGSQEILEYNRAKPGSEKAILWANSVRQAAEQRAIRIKQQTVINTLVEQTELVMTYHGERVAGQLLTALKNDPRFMELERRWFLKEYLQAIDPKLLDSLFRKLLKTGEALPLGTLSEWLGEELPKGDIGLFSLHKALTANTERFAQQVESGQVMWQALRPPPPPWEQAVATCYTYDPQTYRILTWPGQRLTLEAAQRLQELDLYADVVEAA